MNSIIGLEPITTCLKGKYNCCEKTIQKVLSVGFEPTQPKLVDLKSTPLDLSGNSAKIINLI